MFSRYHGRPEEATEKEFESEGDRRWFLTGDTAEMDQEDGTFKILGRTSVDIIKYRTRKGKKIVKFNTVLLFAFAKGQEGTR